MIYDIDTDHYYSFLKAAQKYEAKWMQKFGPKPADPNAEKLLYIDLINGTHT